MYLWKAALQLFTRRHALRNCCLRFEVMVADSWQSASPSICFASNSFFGHQKNVVQPKTWFWQQPFFFCGIGLWQFACLSSPWLSACNHPWDRVAQCCGYGTYMCIGVIYNEIPSEIRWFFAPNGQSRVWRRCFGAKSQILFEMVQKGPDRPKGSKWPKTLRLTILVPFEPLWSVDNPAMFGHFWSKMDHFWAIPSHELWTPKYKKGSSPGLLCVACL